MEGKAPDGGFASQQQLDELTAQVTVNSARIDSLLTRAEDAEARADAADDAGDEQDRRIEHLEARGEVDREMIAVLQAEGILAKAHADHLEEALRSSRRIGAAIGIVMANRKVPEPHAFEILRRASQRANRKVRDIADAVVLTGDVSGLPDE